MKQITQFFGRWDLIFPCGICQKAVAKRHKAICCDLCHKWVHIACNNLNKKTYQNLQSSEISWFCMPYLKKELSFNSISRSLEMHQLLLCPWLKIKVLLIMLTNFFKNNLKIYLTVNTGNHKEKFSLFHLNISFLPSHFQDLLKWSPKVT